MYNYEWRIYQLNQEGKEEVLRWDDMILNFDTKAQAQRFLTSCINNSAHSSDYFDGAYVKRSAHSEDEEEKCLDASCQIVRYDPNEYYDYLDMTAY